jgi:hypothetical protein
VSRVCVCRYIELNEHCARACVRAHTHARDQKRMTAGVLLHVEIVPSPPREWKRRRRGCANDASGGPGGLRMPAAACDVCVRVRGGGERDVWRVSFDLVERAHMTFAYKKPKNARARGSQREQASKDAGEMWGREREEPGRAESSAAAARATCKICWCRRSVCLSRYSLTAIGYSFLWRRRQACVYSGPHLHPSCSSIARTTRSLQSSSNGKLSLLESVHRAATVRGLHQRTLTRLLGGRVH